MPVLLEWSDVMVFWCNGNASLSTFFSNFNTWPDWDPAIVRKGLMNAVQWMFWISATCPNIPFLFSSVFPLSVQNLISRRSRLVCQTIYKLYRIRFTPQVTNEDSSNGLKSTEKILSVCPGAWAWIAWFLQSHTVRVCWSSSPTLANRTPSGENPYM